MRDIKLRHIPDDPRIAWELSSSSLSNSAAHIVSFGGTRFSLVLKYANEVSSIRQTDQYVLKEDRKPRGPIALHFMHCNLARVHQTLPSAPAMKAGVSDHVWTIEETVGLLRTYHLV